MARSRRRRGPRSPFRVAWLSVFLTLAFLSMGARLFVVQILDAEAYARLATDQRARTIEFPARRGAIFDRNGEPLAISVDLKTIYADPALVEDAAAEAKALARVLHIDPAELEAALRGRSPDSRFEYIARQVRPKVAERVAALSLAGIYMREEAKRFYPGGDLASHILGATDTDGRGIAGIESEYEDVLQGLPGEMVLEQDPSGRELPQAESSYRRPEPGGSVFLTIDNQIQYFTELSLADAVGRYRAVAGTAIVMRPRTGEILALANLPDYNPNRPGDFPPAALRNRAVTDVYEPGSAYKIVAVSGAIEGGVVTPATTFLVPDSLAYYDRVFNDSHAHAPERMSVTEIVEQSSNVGTIKIALEMGGPLLQRYVDAFGFGSVTGLDFPGESPGIVVDRDDWSGTSIATIPIGQGIAVTPIQMAAAYAVIANGGMWIEPGLVAAMMNEEGRVVAPPAPRARRVLSAATAEQMTKILSGVVEHGTGIEAQIPGYKVAGKTGTAQKPLPGGGYGSSYIASFAGFVPASRPELVVIVVLDNPTPIWGGTTAAPVFRTIAEFALRHLGVPPTGDAERAALKIEAERSGATSAHD